MSRLEPPHDAAHNAAYRALAHRWWRDPVVFAAEILGTQLWWSQREIARAVRDHRRVAVRSCHAAGKTYLAATLVCWYLYTRRDAVVLTTASTFRQVRYVLWRAIHALARNSRQPLGGELLDTELRLGDRWFALGLSTDQPDRFQGFHAPRLLVVIDEPGAIPEPVFGAIEGVLASGDTRLLMIGNPTANHGPFYDAFHRHADAYRTFRISAFDTPNFTAPSAGAALAGGQGSDDAAIAANLVSREWVEQRRELWGESSDLYRSRVLAEFPQHGADELFSLVLLDAALSAEERGPRAAARTALGVDIARYGRDATAFSWIVGGQLVRQKQYHGASLTETTGRIIEELRRTPGLIVALDDTGVGGGVTDSLREQNWEPLAVNFGAGAEDREHYANRGSELYQRLHDALQPNDPRRAGRLTIVETITTRDALFGELSVVRYRVQSDGRRIVQKRGDRANGPSPDLADSLALAWAAYESPEASPGVW